MLMDRVKRLSNAAGEHQGWMIQCPGCRDDACHNLGYHIFDDRWQFNGDLENPTFKPSLLYHGDNDMPRCHSFVTDGKIRSSR